MSTSSSRRRRSLGTTIIRALRRRRRPLSSSITPRPTASSPCCNSSAPPCSSAHTRRTSCWPSVRPGRGCPLWCDRSSGPWGWRSMPQRLTIGTRNQIWFLRNAPDIAPRVEPAGLHDACYLPRSCHVTGDIGIHELAWAGEELWVVNTRFSCLCTLDSDYSFVPRWRPPFVTALHRRRPVPFERPGLDARPAQVCNRSGRDRHRRRLAGE